MAAAPHYFHHLAFVARFTVAIVATPFVAASFRFAFGLGHSTTTVTALVKELMSVCAK